MDTSFDQFGGGGWGDQGDNEVSASQARQHGIHDKIPIPADIEALIGMIDDEKYTIGGYSFNTVRVMGKIAAVSSPDSSQDTYELCDAMAADARTTKRLTLIHHKGVGGGLPQYHDENEEVFSVGQMVHAVGKLRLYNDRLSLVVFHLREVTMEEVEVFKLECKLASIYYEKKICEQSLGADVEKDTVFQSPALVEPVTPSRSAIAAGAGPGKSATTPTGSRLPLGGGATQSQAGGSQSVNQRQMYQQSQSPAQHLTLQQQNIVEYITNNSVGEDGVHMDKIKAALKPNANFSNELHMLLSEGVIYSTIDEEHFSII